MFCRHFLALSLVTILIVAASTLIGPVAAFQPASPSLSLSSTATNKQSSSVVLHAFKPPTFKKKTPEPVIEKEKSSSALDLITLYMTPWRNPNSIFVYMLILLFALGKYSEAQSAAGNM